MNGPIPDPNVAVRPLRDDDTLALYSACWPALIETQAYERVARALALARRGRAWPLVGLYQDRVVGFGQLARWRHTAEITDLIVGEQWQSHGVGTAIVSRLVGLAAEQGFVRVEIGVAESNVRALSLYRRLGFNQHESHILLDLGHGPERVIYLSRTLQS
jgi:ribosomal protein S18 acetylase RimI-like enzyme